jgi:hypothetical protein
MEEGFYHENPSIAASKIFPPKWHDYSISSTS